MTLRAKIILSFIIGMVFLMVAFGITRVVNFFIKKPSEQAPVSQQQNQQLNDAKPLDELSYGKKENQQQVSQQQNKQGVKAPQGIEAELLLMVRPFVERFGSYSNQSEYENLQELLSFMTPRMRTWAEGKIRERQAGETPSLYTGVTTKALAHKVTSLNEQAGQAEFLVSTQRRESVGSAGNSKVFTQDIIVKLVKEDSVWLVDGAFWQTQ